MKQALSALVVSFGLLVPALASAQELGTKGDMVFSVDRLMGISGTHIEGEMGPVEYDDDITSLSLSWRASPDFSPFDTARLAFDYLIIDHLSVGGSLGYASYDYDEQNDGSIFIFSPRVGYAYAFGKVVGIWPRGGFTYHSTSVDTLFDEKIGGSFHLTPGQAYEEADNGNDSRIHWDLVLIQRADYGGGEIWFDGELLRKDGFFVPKDLQGLNAGL